MAVTGQRLLAARGQILMAAHTLIPQRREGDTLRHMRDAHAAGVGAGY
jgi:hypothetical protein